MKVSRDLIKTAAAIGVFALVGFLAYDHFHDGPPPDLSRFKRVPHDPVAFAEIKRLTDRFRTEYKPYAPVDPGDPDDMEIEDEARTLRGAARLGDKDAIRALRRYLAENAAALATARELVASTAFAIEPPLPGNASATRHETLTQTREAERLLSDRRLLAGIEGRTEEEWRILADEKRLSGLEVAAAPALFPSVRGIDTSTRTDEDAILLAAYETHPGNIAAFLSATTAHRPDSKEFFRVLHGEVLLYADSIMPSRGGTLDIGAEFYGTPTWDDFKERPLETTRKLWLDANTLPNDLVRDYARFVDAYCTPRAGDDEAPRKRPEWGIWLLARNAGGENISDVFKYPTSAVAFGFGKAAAIHDLTRLALAVRIHRLAHDGANPKSSDDLKSYLTEGSPDDVLSPGHPYRYDPETGKVWSVGADGKDDGGDAENHDDIVVAIPAIRPPQP